MEAWQRQYMFVHFCRVLNTLLHYYSCLNITSPLRLPHELLNQYSDRQKRARPQYRQPGRDGKGNFRIEVYSLNMFFLTLLNPPSNLDHSYQRLCFVMKKIRPGSCLATLITDMYL